MFFLSWLTARGSGTGSVCLITDTDSPADNLKQTTDHMSVCWLKLLMQH